MEVKKNNIAVIPARGGSKRILKKNIYLFYKLPLIAYSISAAFNSKLFSKVIVSTDDESIADISKQYGAEVPFTRPSELSTDTAGIHEVISHSIEWLKTKNLNPDYVCCISATAPFLKYSDLQNSYEELVSSGRSYVFSATPYTFPIQRSFRFNEQGGVELFYPEHYHSRSQDLEKSFHDAAQFYWGTVDTWIAEKDIYTNDSIPYILPSWRVQDIDTMEDLERAEILYKVIEKMESKDDE